MYFVNCFTFGINMTSNVSEFICAPSEALLAGFTKDQLLKLADHYGIAISDKRLKETVRSSLVASLIEIKVLPVSVDVDVPFHPAPVLVPSVLTYEQQKELLLLQLEHDRGRYI